MVTAVHPWKLRDDCDDNALVPCRKMHLAGNDVSVDTSIPDCRGTVCRDVTVCVRESGMR
jgi:hypothetical protein